MELFKLVGKIFVDSDEANKSISKTGENAEGLGNKLASGIGKAAKWAAGVAGAATAVGAAMVGAAKDTASNLDVIDKASIRMGIAAESYQELAHAADLSGVSMSTLERAAKSLVDTDMTFDEALDSLMAIEDESDRTAAAVEMFGEKVAYDMQPLLSAGADGLAAMKKEANDLGLVMSQETVTSGAAMNDMFTKVEASVKALKTNLMTQFMPYVMEILQWLIDNLPTIIETVRGVLDAIMPIVKPVLDAVMALLPPIMDAVKALMDWLKPYIENAMRVVSNIINSIMALMNGDIDGFLSGIVNALKGLVSLVFNLGKDIFKGLWDGMKSVWNTISSWVSEKVSWLVDKLTFWNNGKNKMQTDGSHAAGLAFVPYDGYTAELHRGETVLNSDNSQKLLNALNSLSQGGNSEEQTINIQLMLDKEVIGETAYKYSRNRQKAYGATW